MSIGLSIVGLGLAGTAMLGAAFGHDQVTVEAIADTDIEWLGPGTGEPRRYRSLDRLLADDHVEAVHIATPTPLHFEHVLQALHAGRHVIVEKPLTATLREAEELMARAAAFDRVVIVGHSESFEPYVQATRGAVASGAIGTPTMVIAEKFTDWMRRPRLPAEWDGASGGGLIRRQGVHQVDVVRTITGTDFSVREAKLRLDQERGVPGTYTAWLSSDDGPSAVITHDGVGRLSPAGIRPVTEDTDEASKQSRRRALLRRVLEGRSGIRLGEADRERLLVFGTGGEIVASSRQVDVITSAGARPVDLTAFAAGRHAVLDELVAATSGASGAVHDLAWGYESLRTCEDIERAARPAHAVLTGNCIDMTSQLLELGMRAAAPAAPQTRALARLHLLDALVAAFAGNATPEGSDAVRHLESLGGGRETSPAEIVLTLARLIRVTELDDLQLESVTTAAAAVVPALAGAAAVAGKSGCSADDVLSAMTAGYDVMGTLGLAVGGPDFIYRQGGWPSLVAAGPAAAAAAGRLLGLDAEEIAHAIALAALSTPRSLRGSGESGRWLSFGLAATAGFHAAVAARSGSRGDLGLLDQDRGRGGTSGRELFPGLHAALERPWEPGRGLAMAHLKQWASAGQVAAAIDAVGVLQDTHGFSADGVVAVDVHVPPAYRRMIDQPTGSGRLWSLVSAQYQIATRLLHPQDLFDCARPLRDSPGFRRLMGAVRVHQEESLAARHPESYPARVAVTLRGGVFADYLSDGRSPTPRWDWDSVSTKARAVAARAAVEDRIDPLAEAVIGFSDSTEFLRAALPAVSPASAPDSSQYGGPRRRPGPGPGRASQMVRRFRHLGRA